MCTSAKDIRDLIAVRFFAIFAAILAAFFRRTITVFVRTLAGRFSHDHTPLAGGLFGYQGVETMLGLIRREVKRALTITLVSRRTTSVSLTTNA